MYVHYKQKRLLTATGMLLYQSNNG